MARGLISTIALLASAAWVGGLSWYTYGLGISENFLSGPWYDIADYCPCAQPESTSIIAHSYVLDVGFYTLIGGLLVIWALAALILRRGREARPGAQNSLNATSI